MTARRLGGFVVGAVLTAALAGCSAPAAEPTSTAATHTATTATTPSTLGKGFYDPSDPPPPEGTITPSPGSWDHATPPAGYTAVLLTYGDDKVTVALAEGVRRWAKDEGVALTTVTAPSPDGLIDSVYTAIDKHADVIISAGNQMIDPVAAVSPAFLQQNFLVVGGETAEPTSNVTAVDWEGGNFKGEGLGLPAGYDADSFTPDRIDRAIRAGEAAVLNGVTGILVRIS